jgi:hypothetical protein
MTEGIIAPAEVLVSNGDEYADESEESWDDA